MNRNQKELNIKKLLKDYSIETTPNVYEKYGKFSNLVEINNTIYDKISERQKIQLENRYQVTDAPINNTSKDTNQNMICKNGPFGIRTINEIN